MRSWSIRARTALAFAVASMALTAAVLVFVALASQSSLRGAVQLPDRQGQVSGTPAPGVPSGLVVPDATAPPGVQEGTAFVAQASTLQWQWSAVGVVVAGVLAGGVGWYVSRRMLRPVERITATTNRISASNLHERVALVGPDDELRRLSETIDALLQRLETAFESQRRFVAQASHELRTPLAVQRAALQIGLVHGAGPEEVAAAREDLLEQNRRTEHLVESLLVLAEADRGLDDRRVPIDLAGLVRRGVDEVLPAADRAGVTVTCRDDPARSVVTGDPVLVGQLVANLLDNAVEYNVPDGSVTVVTDGAGVTVENTGPVVPDDVVATLTEPFRRHGGGGTHRHSGLGLSIVAAVVRAHGWRLVIAPRPGGGLRVRVEVPRD